MRENDRDTGRVYIVWACSMACRDNLWKTGPGPDIIEDSRLDPFDMKSVSTKAPTSASTSTKSRITLRVRADSARHACAGRVVTLDGQVVKIGRVASAHLRLDDPSVGRMHAIIEARTAAEAVIIDLGSVNGTFVNGQRASKLAIRSGDVVKVGEVEVEVTIVEAR